MLCDVTFFAYTDQTVEGHAICQIDQGPSDVVALRGSAATESFRFSTTKVVFSGISSHREKRRTVDIINEHDLPLKFEVLSRSERVVVGPTSGIVSSSGKQSLVFELAGNAPDRFEEDLLIQVGTDLPRAIKMVSDSSFPTMSLSLPRAQPDSHELAPSSQDWNAAEATAAKLELNFNVELDRAVLARTLLVTEAGGNGPSLVPSLGKVKVPAYVLGLGPVVRGATQSHTFTISNPYAAPLSMQPTRKSLLRLTAAGMSISPDVIRDLPPDEVVEVTLTLNTLAAQSLEYPLGDIEDVLVYQLADGPRVPLIVKARVCVPSLQAAITEYNFDTVSLGDVSRTASCASILGLTLVWYRQRFFDSSCLTQSQYLVSSSSRRGKERFQRPLATSNRFVILWH
jgi:hypothetical protein